MGDDVMSRHTITEKEITDWLTADAWHLAASSAGNGSNKRLETNKGTFRVKDHGEITYAGDSVSAAVDAYNQAK